MFDTEKRRNPTKKRKILRKGLPRKSFTPANFETRQTQGPQPLGFLFVIQIRFSFYSLFI